MLPIFQYIHIFLGGSSGRKSIDFNERSTSRVFITKVKLIKKLSYNVLGGSSGKKS